VSATPSSYPSLGNGRPSRACPQRADRELQQARSVATVLSSTVGQYISGLAVQQRVNCKGYLPVMSRRPVDYCGARSPATMTVRGVAEKASLRGCSARLSTVAIRGVAGCVTASGHRPAHTKRLPASRSAYTPAPIAKRRTDLGATTRLFRLATQKTSL
jgi:hypothetical protein